MAYDAKAIKLPKQVKRSATAYTDPHQRGSFIRSFVRILESENQRGSARKSKDVK
jgi:hypothetical protein